MWMFDCTDRSHWLGVSLKSQRTFALRTFVDGTWRLDECSHNETRDILLLKTNGNPGRNAPKWDTDLVYKKDIQFEVTVRTDD